MKRFASLLLCVLMVVPMAITTAAFAAEPTEPGIQPQFSNPTTGDDTTVDGARYYYFGYVTGAGKFGEAVTKFEITGNSDATSKAASYEKYVGASGGVTLLGVSPSGGTFTPVGKTVTGLSNQARAQGTFSHSIVNVYGSHAFKCTKANINWSGWTQIDEVSEAKDLPKDSSLY